MRSSTPRFGIFHIILLAILAFGGYFGVKKYQKTQEIEATKASMAKIDAIYSDWKEANKIAMSVPRIALAAPLAKLQEIKKRVSDVPAANCAAEAKSKLIGAMDMQINGFLAFLQQESSTAEESLISAVMQLTEYGALSEKCGK
jgi:predicted negative regulator of RcsB-dependent stress response